VACGCGGSNPVPEEVKKSMIVLINPPYVSEWGPRVNIGLGYIASVLREHGIKVRIVDATAKKVTVDEIVAVVASLDPDIVGVSSIAATYPISLRICKALKDTLSVFTVMGGLMPTYLDRETAGYEYVDAVVRGEGEYTFLELVESYYKGRNTATRGVTLKRNGSVVRNPDRPLIENLDELPFPAYDLFPTKELMRQSIPKNAAVMSTSRGCPYNCAFCSMNTFFKRKWRGRSAKNVFEEMKVLRHEYGVEELQIVDELFTFDMKRVDKISDFLIKDETGLKWICESRVDRLSQALLDKMKKAGCYAVCLGVESGVQSILDKVGKGIDLHQVERVVRACKKAGIKAIGSFIIGLPLETEATARQTLDYIKKLDFDRVIIHNLNPYPGSEISEHPEEYGITVINKQFSTYHFFAPVCETEGFSIKQQARLWLDILCDPFFVKRGITIP
jgi:anaerobic magnesium-protoporphyrin IX monomethyl ester cyclase